MSRKNVFASKIVSAHSLAADFTSPPTVVRYQDNIAYQINITTSDSIGTFSVEASVDYAVNETTGAVSNPGTWTSLPLSGTPEASAANDTILINLNNIPFEAVRLRYTSSTAGTGIVDEYIMCRQVGG